jgi:hypothetical protein
MIERGPASADEMVLTFIRNEIDSPRFAEFYAKGIAKYGLDRAELIDRADLSDKRANWNRIRILGWVRGYFTTADNTLFTRFPRDARWRRVFLEQSDIVRLRYPNCAPWLQMPPGNRRVIDCAHNYLDMPVIRKPFRVADNVKAQITEMVATAKLGDCLPELIVVEGKGEELILIDGNCRATAFVIAGPPDLIPAMLGSSPRMHEWQWY